MSLTVNASAGFPPIEAGTYQAICYQVIDIGTHHNTLFDKDNKQVLLAWEIPSERIDLERDGQMVNLPRAISKIYTASLHEKAKLYQHLVGWRGVPFTVEELEAFDLRSVLGTNCMLSISNEQSQGSTKKIVAKVASVAKLMKGLTVCKPENPVISFDMDIDGYTNIPEGLPDWIKEQIKSSVEYKAVTHAQNSDELKATQDAMGTPKSDIPF
jgi:hypothetical protein